MMQKKSPIIFRNKNITNISREQDLEKKQENFINVVSEAEAEAEPIINKIVPIYQIIIGIIFTGITFWIFIQAGNMMTRLFITPFLICGLCILAMSIVKLIRAFTQNNYSKKEQSTTINVQYILNKAQSILGKIYDISFFIFWFGFLIFWDYLVIKDWKNNGLYLLCFSLIFWVVGIFVAYKKKR